MTTPITAIEDIILQDDIRGMKALRAHMKDEWLDSSAQLLLDRPGKVLIATGFYILRASEPETHGPPGAVAISPLVTALAPPVPHDSSAP